MLLGYAWITDRGGLKPSLDGFLAELPEETIFVTKPHMYGHSSTSVNVAFSPDADKHESTIYFEPITGTPIRVQSRIQLNVNAWIDRIKVEDDKGSS